MATERRVRVLVSGRVQGVCFRASTRTAALELGLRGWVKNRADGRVEAAFAGTAEQVTQVIAWCRQGPPGARVDDVAVSDEPAVECWVGFEVRA